MIVLESEVIYLNDTFTDSVVAQHANVQVRFGSTAVQVEDVSGPRVRVTVPNGLSAGRPDLIVAIGTRRSAAFNGFAVETYEPPWRWFVYAGVGALGIAGLLLLWWYLRRAELREKAATRAQRAYEQQAERLTEERIDADDRARQIAEEQQQRERELREELKSLRALVDLGRVADSSGTGSVFDVDLPDGPPKVPSKLVGLCVERRCVLYGGAGLAAQAGLPTWRELLARLVNVAYGNDRTRKDTLLRALSEGGAGNVADLVTARLTREELASVLVETYGNSDGNPSIFQDLGDIPFTNALTTAYDRHLDRAFARRSPRVIAGSELEGAGAIVPDNQFFLAKLQGDPRTPETLRMTDEDFTNHLADHPTLAKFLSTQATSNSLLFLGCALRSIEAFFSSLRLRTKPVHEHFALMPFQSDWEVQSAVFSAKYNVTLLGFKPTAGFPEVAAFVANLSAQVREAAPSLQRTHIEPWILFEVRLQNIGAFRSLTLRPSEKWNVLLGNNGSGKSTVLKAIALGLCGDDPKAAASGGRLLRRDAKNGKIELVVGDSTYTTTLVRDGERVQVKSEGLTPLQKGSWVVLGFPPLRGISASSSRGPGRDGSPYPVVGDLLPLIAEAADARLDSLRQWLVNVSVNAIEGGGVSAERAARNGALRRSFFDTMAALTPGVTLEFAEVDRQRWDIDVLTDDGTVPIGYVSQGMSSLLGWMGTLLQRMYEIHRDSNNPEQAPALVLVDEIDAHLHPVWQQALVAAVQERFPKLQVIATTHSPLVVAGLRASEVFIARRADHDGDELFDDVSVEPAPFEIEGLRSDQILTSPLFGLTMTRSPATVRRYTELLTKEQRSTQENIDLTSLRDRLAPNILSAEGEAERVAESERIRMEDEENSVEAILREQDRRAGVHKAAQARSALKAELSQRPKEK